MRARLITERERQARRSSAGRRASLFDDRDSRMTQQSEADDGRDDAATDAVGHGIHESRQRSSGARDDPGNACDIESAVTRLPSLHLNDTMRACMWTDLALSLIHISEPTRPY